MLLEEGETVTRLFRRYFSEASLTQVSSLDGAVAELSRAPAHALIINASMTFPTQESVRPPQAIPYGTPVITCSVPGGQEAAQQLGIVRYITKPVTLDSLLEMLDDLAAPGGTILIADDELEELQLFTRMVALSQNHYRVLQAKTGQRALDLMRERKPDLVLLDLIMPGKDGFQVLREKSADDAIRAIPVVVVTAQNPSGEPVISNTISATYPGGLSAHELMACVQALSAAVVPAALPVDRVQPETPLV